MPRLPPKQPPGPKLKRKKTEAKALAAEKALANKICNKLAGPILTLANLMEKPASLGVPSNVSSKVEGTLKDMRTLEKQARLALEDESAPVPAEGMKEADALVKASKRYEHFWISLFSNLNKFS